ncbi:hypothetical protein JCM1840_000888 [Sporobolomyces johnsonii]
MDPPPIAGPSRASTSAGPSTLSATSSGGKQKRGAASGASEQAKDERTAIKRTRQRQALSCQECRRLKLKCDREWPCSACRKRGCADICPTGVSKPPGRAVRVQAEMTLMLRRIDDLEKMVRDLGGGDQIPPPLQLEIATRRATAFSKELEAEIEDASAEGSSETTPMEDEDEDGGATQEGGDMRSDEEKLKSLLVGVGSLSIADSGRTRFLGTSAGPAYYFEDDEGPDSDDTETVDEDAYSTDQITRYPYIQLGQGYPKASEIERLRNFLPPMQEAKRLSENYWNFLSFQFTPIEENVYWSDYWTSAWTPNDPAGTKLAAVFMILSLGSLFDPTAPSTPNLTAHHYFVLAHTTLSAARFLANNTLAAVQTLQLSSAYLLCQHDLREGGESLFPWLGVILRMLVTQGLHRDGSNFGLSGAELNTRRRVFYDAITLERMQDFISGRPYMLHNSHFDTRMPDDAEPYQIAKWKLGIFIGKVIDSAFSVATPSYSTILQLDQELRELVREAPKELRSGALPDDAFLVKPKGIPQVPAGPPPSDKTLKYQMQQHTMDQMFGQVLFYLHKPAFAQALIKHPEEPLQSPWAASVAAISLETAVYLLAVAKSWIQLHPILCPRWWHIFFHAFAASVAQSSLVIKSPTSMLAPHAWSQLNQAVAIFETAGSSGAPVAMFVPRLQLLRQKAYLSLQNIISVPLGLGRGDVSDSLAEGTDVNLSILNPPARLERKPRRKAAQPAGRAGSAGLSSTDGSSPNSVLAQMLGATPALSVHAPPVSTTVADPSEAQPYTPFDSPILKEATLAFPTLSSAMPLSPVYASQAAPYPPITFLPHQPMPNFGQQHQPQRRSAYAAGPSQPPSQSQAPQVSPPATAASFYNSSALSFSSFNASAGASASPPSYPSPSNLFPDPARRPSGTFSGVPSQPNAAEQSQQAPSPPNLTFGNFATAFPSIDMAMSGAGGQDEGAAGATLGGSGMSDWGSMDEQPGEVAVGGTGPDGWMWYDVLGANPNATALSPLNFDKYTQLGDS